MPQKKRALISVSDRSGLVSFAATLVRHGYQLVSTGGTARFLSENGFPVTEVSELTGFPEVFGGRVKTLHPAIFGGILFDREETQHREEAEKNGIEPFDIVAVNLYPFEETVSREGVSLKEAIEKIDIGGPSLLRAAAKNHKHVAVVCDASEYVALAAELDEKGFVSEETKARLALEVFRRTAAYDAAISRWLGSALQAEVFPRRLGLSFERLQELRYGENPHQAAALYVDPAARAALSRFEKIQGKELSYNNFLDADSALFAARGTGPGSLVIVKHRIPSGIAQGGNPLEVFEQAWASDPVSAFGGVVAFLGEIDEPMAHAMAKHFLEVVVAYGATAEAREILKSKPNLRVLLISPKDQETASLEARSIDGGLLVQQADLSADDETAWKTVTRCVPSEAEWESLRFAFRAVRGVISNAILLATKTASVGIGGGRTSRVDACRDAVDKAGPRATGAVAASDAFFPFPDGLQVLAEAGVTAVIQPGGSIRDKDVIKAADDRGIAMVFTSRRHFRH